MSGISGFPPARSGATVGAAFHAATPLAGDPAPAADARVGIPGSSMTPLVVNAQAAAASRIMGTDPRAGERAERNRLLNHMLEGSGIGNRRETDRRRREVISSGMDAFSLDQLQRMDQGHLQFRVADIAGERESGKYVTQPYFRPNGPHHEYVEESRTPTITLDQHALDGGGADAEHVVRHEMAHAWDDAQYDDVLHLHRNSPADVSVYLSTSGEKVFTDANGRSFSIGDMYHGYLQHLQSHPADTIHGHGVDPHHSAESASEFYAEGYAVFHGNDPIARRRLQGASPELYAYLHQEANARGTMPRGPF